MRYTKIYENHFSINLLSGVDRRGACGGPDRQKQNQDHLEGGEKSVNGTNTNTHVQGAHLQTHTNTLPAVQSNTKFQSNKFHSNTTNQSNKFQSNTTLQVEHDASVKQVPFEQVPIEREV